MRLRFYFNIFSLFPDVFEIILTDKSYFDLMVLKREKKTMVTVTIENGKFKFHGSFDCGYAGIYHDDMIDFSYQDLESIRKKGLQGKDLSNCSDDEIAAEVAAYFNSIEANVQQNIRQFNDTFLDNLFDDLEGCGYPFWDYPNMVNQEFMQAHPDFKAYDSDDEDFSDEVSIPPAAGERETVLRQTYPSFNFDYYLSHITPHILSVNDNGSFGFEISDDMDYLCHLVGEVRPDISFSDWNNG